MMSSSVLGILWIVLALLISTSIAEKCNYDEFFGDEKVCTEIDELTIKFGDSLPKNMKTLKIIHNTLKVNGWNHVLAFPELTSIGSDTLDEPALVIENCAGMKSFSLPELQYIKTQSGTLFAIWKNDTDPSTPMTKEELEKLGSAIYSYMFNCDFGRQIVTKLEAIKWCKYIKGDLLLHKTKPGPLENTLYSIEGCVQIKNTELENLDFLENSYDSLENACMTVKGDSAFEGNKKLCINNVAQGWGKEIVRKIDFRTDQECDMPCTYDEYIRKNYICNVLTDSLTFHGNTEIPHLKYLAQRLKKVIGDLRFENVQVEELNFPELVSIETDSDDYSLYIDASSEHSRLQKISFPKLASLKSLHESKVFIAYKNGSFMTEEFEDQLLKAMDTDKEDYEYNCAPGNISDLSVLQWCKGIDQDLRIMHDVSGNVPTSVISYVKGCIAIENTTLDTIEFLFFAKDGGWDCGSEHVIKGNKDLCVSPQQEENIRQFFTSVAITIAENKPREECVNMCRAKDGIILEKHECVLVKGNLKIMNNCTDNSAFVNVTEIHGRLEINNCSLTSIFSLFPKLKKISARRGIALNLENITGTFKTNELFDLGLESKNNLSLRLKTKEKVPYLTVLKMKSWFGEQKVSVENSEKVPNGVCAFHGEAKEVKKGCKKVEGDLILNEKSKSVTGDLKEVTGCLILKKTKLNDYEFLSKISKIGGKCVSKQGATEITDNACIPYKDRKRVTVASLKKEVDKATNKKECYECHGGVQKTGIQCKVIIGDLIVNDTVKQEQLEKITEVYGRVVVKGTSHKEIVFKELKVIDASESKGPAIEITNNEKLKKLSLPALSVTKAKGNVTIRITGNPNLEQTKELMESLSRVTGKPCSDKEDSACEFSRSKRTENEEKEDEEETGVGGGVVAGFVVLSLIVAALLIAVIALAVVLILRKSKKEGPSGKKKTTDTKSMVKSANVKTKKTKSVASVTGKSTEASKMTADTQQTGTTGVGAVGGAEKEEVKSGDTGGQPASKATGAQGDAQEPSTTKKPEASV